MHLTLQGLSFQEKTFTYFTSSAASGHATTVAVNQYGNLSSIAPSVTTIDIYSADNWLAGYLNIGSAANAPGCFCFESTSCES